MLFVLLYATAAFSQEALRPEDRSAITELFQSAKRLEAAKEYAKAAEQYE